MDRLEKIKQDFENHQTEYKGKCGMSPHEKCVVCWLISEVERLRKENTRLAVRQLYDCVDYLQETNDCYRKALEEIAGYYIDLPNELSTKLEFRHDGMNELAEIATTALKGGEDV